LDIAKASALQLFSLNADVCFAEILLPVYQIGSPTAHLLLIFVLYLIFHPSWHRAPIINTLSITASDEIDHIDVTKQHADPQPTTRIARALSWLAAKEWHVALISFVLFVILFLVGFSMLALLLIEEDGVNGAQVLLFARACGLIAVVFNILQWAPQIVLTFRNGVSFVILRIVCAFCSFAVCV
jgi:hypothetical protein